MKSWPLPLASITLAGLALACNNSGVLSNCDSTADCDSGIVCLENVCRQLCSPVDGCPTGQHCSSAGICDADTPPTLTSVIGNGATDRDIVDGLEVTGVNLGGGVFSLVSAEGTVSLVATSVEATAAHLQLPADVESGVYTLQVVNAAGEDGVEIELLLPEITPDRALELVNAAAGTVSIDRLPVGETDAHVAAGDHVHAGGGGGDTQWGDWTEVATSDVNCTTGTCGVTAFGIPVQYRVYDDGTVCLRGGISVSGGEANGDLFTVAEEARALHEHYASFVNPANGTTNLVAMQTSGRFSLFSGSVSALTFDGYCYNKEATP